MISTVYLNENYKYIISKDFIQYLLKLDALNYLKKEELINEQLYLDTILQIKNSYISKK